MCSSMFVTCLLCWITNLLGCWQLGESSTYVINPNGECSLISKEISNIPPTISFLYNGKGIVKYCNGKTLSFNWQQELDNSICVECDSIGKKSFIVQITESRLVLKEATNNGLINEYILKHSNLKIEEYEGPEIKIMDFEYDFLKNKNPFPDLACFVVKGYEKNNSTLLIGGQEYWEIMNGLPYTQCVVFVKGSKRQRNIPCYLVSRVKSKSGIIPVANYIGHFKRSAITGNIRNHRITKIKNQRGLVPVSLIMIS